VLELRCACLHGNLKVGPRASLPLSPPPIWYYRWIKTPCGRAKYIALADRRGPLAALRLGWFVMIAGLRDWSLPNPDHSGSSTP
jgi:hypothetical protein